MALVLHVAFRSGAYEASVATRDQPRQFTSHPNRKAMERSVAIAAARVVGVASRRFGHDGTSLPGLIAEKIHPAILSELAGSGPVITVLGTNGKTTTTHLIATILGHVQGSPSVTNRSGANLRQSIITTLLASGRSDARPATAVLEVDELAFESVAAALRPSVVVILNLFRDQLDRYGEIDLVQDRLATGLARLPPDSILVTCADDPRLEALAKNAGLGVRRFGLASRHDAAVDGERDRIGDPAHCPDCGHIVTYQAEFAPGLGPWSCSGCGRSRAEPDLLVTPSPAVDGVHLDFRMGRAGRAIDVGSIDVGLVGTGGAYDAAAAVLAATALGIDREAAIQAIAGVQPAFGRLEQAWVGDRRIVLTLVKNPASFAQALEAIESIAPDVLLFGLGDRPADGRDISWIWDIDVDRLRAIHSIVLTGSRADDLAVRFKYSDEAQKATSRPPLTVASTEQAIDRSLGATPDRGTFVIMATYTALLGIRKALQRRGVVPAAPR